MEIYPNINLEIERTDTYEANVFLNGKFLCGISWEEKSEFMEKITQAFEAVTSVIDEYRI